MVIPKKILRAVFRRIKSVFPLGDMLVEGRLERYFCILNVNFDSTVEQRRALLVYVPTIFHTTQSANRIVHTNVLESAEIVRQLIHRDFCVDVFDCNKGAEELRKILNGKNYDLIIGLGDAFEAACGMFADAKNVIYLTENHPDISAKNESERLERYTVACGRSAKVERSNVYFKKGAISNHDYGIVLGDMEPYQCESLRMFSLCPTGFANPGYDYSVEDFEAARRTFIWMGTNAPIHKGLDVLFEAFAGVPELKLNVIGMSKDQLAKYGLRPPENVIVHGFMNIGSSAFINIVRNSCFFILPSCSEAMSTSVLTGMRHGLIPMVLPHVGMDGIPVNLRISLDGYLPAELKRNIEEAASMEIPALRELREKIYEYANKQYTMGRYARELGLILDEILQ